MTGSRTAWPIAGLVLGLTPMAIYTTMVPSPNGVELAAATVLWCSLLALQRAPDRFQGRLFLAAGLAGAILGSVRLTGPVVILLIVTFATLSAPRRTWSLVASRWRWAVGVAITALTATLYQVDWTFTQPPVSVLHEGRPFDLGVIMGQVLLWIFQWIGAFPLRGNPTSPVTYAACLIAFVVFFVEGLRRGDARRWLALSVVVTALVLPLLFTLATFTEKGTFWQGRYALPLAIGAPILVGLALDRPGRDNRMVQQFVALSGGVSTGAAVIGLVHRELGRSVSANDPHWHAPAAYAIVLVAAAAAASFSRAIAWSAVEVPVPEGSVPFAGKRTAADV
jgi:hypothetical protein